MGYYNMGERRSIVIAVLEKIIEAQNEHIEYMVRDSNTHMSSGLGHDEIEVIFRHVDREFRIDTIEIRFLVDCQYSRGISQIEDVIYGKYVEIRKSIDRSKLEHSRHKLNDPARNLFASTGLEGAPKLIKEGCADNELLLLIIK
jgi:hypothetical protein